MEYRSIIFYFSLFLSVLCVAEIYVRMKGIGSRAEKIHGVFVPNKPKLLATFVLLIAAIAGAVITAPH